MRNFLIDEIVKSLVIVKSPYHRHSGLDPESSIKLILFIFSGPRLGGRGDGIWTPARGPG